MNTESYICISVPAGWQTARLTADFLIADVFGPVYRDVTGLWAWQRENLYKNQEVVSH